MILILENDTKFTKIEQKDISLRFSFPPNFFIRFVGVCLVEWE